MVQHKCTYLGIYDPSISQPIKNKVQLTYQVLMFDLPTLSPQVHPADGALGHLLTESSTVCVTATYILARQRIRIYQ